jgi:hypothetical protein
MSRAAYSLSEKMHHVAAYKEWKVDGSPSGREERSLIRYQKAFCPEIPAETLKKWVKQEDTLIEQSQGTVPSFPTALVSAHRSLGLFWLGSTNTSDYHSLFDRWGRSRELLESEGRCPDSCCGAPFSRVPQSVCSYTGGGSS